MPAAFAIVSFVCVALLAVFIPVKRVRTSVPHLAIILWLAGLNLVHAINAVIWDGNVDNRAPVWCDITTKLILGANIAVPGAFLCIARDLEHLSSSRRFSLDKSTIRNRTILELGFCYVIPFIYMLLHLIAQDRRFDLVQDYGCSASIQPSLFPFFLIWIPPLTLCSIAIFLCVLSVSHVFRFDPARFVVHVESRLDSPASIFNRRLAVCMITTIVLTVVRIFSLFLNPPFVPWVSWESVHALFSQIEIVMTRVGLQAIQFDWWGVFGVSVLFFILSYLIGEESRDIGEWMRKQRFNKRDPFSVRKLILPLSRPRDTTPGDMDSVSRSASLSKPQPRPLTLELRSGWDDMLDIKTPKFKTSFKGLRGPKTPSPTCASPTPSTSTQSAVDDDRSFAVSTLSYLGSSTAKSLGIAPPVFVAPTPPRPKLDIPPIPMSPPPLPPPALSRSPSKDNLTSVKRPAEGISTVLDASWPVPPASPVPSLVPSRHASISRGRARSLSRSGSSSPTSSMEDCSSFGYPLYPTVTPPHLRSKPFEGSISDVPSPTKSEIKALKSVLKRPSLKSLRRSWSKESIGQVQASGDVIHMSVVQEIV